MRYVSAVTDDVVRAELMGDLSGLTIGSAFLLPSSQLVNRVLKMCDEAAKKAYDENVEKKRPAEVECITIDAGTPIGFDCLLPVSELPEKSVVVPVYRYFDSPRETIVSAAIVAPSQLKKTRDITFFCGPDRRQSGDYRIFSIHPGPKRQVFPSRYQPEAQRMANRDYWDRHVFLATPNQIIAAKRMMRENFNSLEPEAQDRVFHMTRQMEAALHSWYGTFDQLAAERDMGSLMAGTQAIGEFALAPTGVVYYYLHAQGSPPPDLTQPDQVENLLHNRSRPAIIRPDGGEEYFVNGKRHREGAPAVACPTPEGGWLEVWYENGVISRQPDEGPAKIVYDAKGEIIEEVSIFKGAEVEATTLGDAAEPIKAMQNQMTLLAEDFKWYEQAQDFSLLRIQVESAVNRSKQPVDKIIRQMQPKDEQVGLRWDFDHTLEQDPKLREAFERMKANADRLCTLLIEASQAMRFVRGDENIINGIWGKIIRDTERLIARGKAIPAIEPGKTIADELMIAKDETKKYFQSASELSKMFSATGR